MIKINLLASENIKKEEPKEIIALAVIVMAVFCVVGLVKYTLKLSALKKIEYSISRTQQELSKYEEIVRQVDALQATKSVLETKKNVIDTLMRGRLLYPKFMEELLGLMPSNIWLKTMNTAAQPDGRIKVDITAESLDNYSIADFVTALSSNGDFTAIELGAVSSAGDQRNPTSNFGVNFFYKKIKND